MPVTYTQEIFDIGAIKPVALNPSIMEGEKQISSLYGPKSALKIERFAPTNSTPPSVSGDIRIPSTLTCAPGSWLGSPQPLFTYQWYVDGVLIDGATGSTFTTYDSLNNQTLTCEVTGTNILGSVDVLSSNGVLVLLVEPVNVMDNHIYVIRGFSGENRFDVNHNGIFVVTGLPQADQLNVLNNDIYTIHFIA